MAGIPSLCHLLDSSCPRTRESRFGLRPISLDTRFRGYDGTQVTSSLWETIALHLYISKEDPKVRQFRLLLGARRVLRSELSFANLRSLRPLRLIIRFRIFLLVAALARSESSW